MSKQSTPPGDDYQVRCARLGHQVPFSYCRSENQGLPCFKVLDCWYDHFLVEEFLRSVLSPGEWERLFHRSPRPKILTLVDLIERAKGGEDT